MSTLHSSYFPQLTFTASKRRQMALNQKEQLHLKWQVPLFKDPALLFPLQVLTRLLGEVKEKLQIHNQNSFPGSVFLSATFRLLVPALQCSLKHPVCLFYGHVCLRNTNCHSACSCGNCQHAFSGISLKKADKKREQKHFIVLYIWKYMSEYWKKKCIC